MYTNYLGANERSKTKLRELCADNLKTGVSNSDILLNTHKIMNSPEYQNLGVQARTGDLLNAWYQELGNANLAHKRNMAMLMNKLPQIVSSSVPNSEKLTMDLKQAVDRYQKEANLLPGFINPADTKGRVTDLLRVVDPKHTQLLGPHPPIVPIGTGIGRRAQPHPSPARLAVNQTPGNMVRSDSRRVIRNNGSMARLQVTPGTPLMNRVSQSGLPSKIQPPKYYRIDEKGNRIPIEKPTASFQQQPPQARGLSPSTRLGANLNLPNKPGLNTSLQRSSVRPGVSPMRRNNSTTNGLHSPMVRRPSHRAIPVVPAGAGGINRTPSRNRLSASPAPQMPINPSMGTAPAGTIQGQRPTIPNGVVIGTPIKVKPSLLRPAAAAGQAPGVENPDGNPYGMNVPVQAPQAPYRPPQHPYRPPVPTPPPQPQPVVQQQPLVTENPGIYSNEVPTMINDEIRYQSKNIPTMPNVSAQAKQMIEDAKADFGNPVLEDFDCDDNPFKIESNSDGSRLYYGGDTLGEVERINKWLTNRGRAVDLPLCTLKVLPNGDIICNDLNNWDLILMDKNYMEKKRVSGVGTGIPRYYRFMRTRVADDDRHFVWMRGESDISLVDIRDFSARHIHNFWNFRGENSKGTVVAIDPQATKVVGIGFIEVPKGYQTIHVYDGTDGVTAFEANDIIPDVKAWLCLESSIDGDAFFIGGAESRTLESGDAFLAALTFDENAELINFSRFDTEFHCINALRRHPEGNILFAGCRGYLAVILWVEDNFHLISKLPNVVSSPIADVCFNDNVVYTVCEHNVGRCYYFDDETIAGRDPRYRNQGVEPQNAQAVSAGNRLRPKNPSSGTLPSKYMNNFAEYKIKQIAIPNAELQRIQVTEDQRYIFTGKRDLKVLELRGDRYTLMNFGDHIKNFIDLKLLSNGELIVYSEENSDLIKYDRNLNEINRLKGKKKIELEGSEIVTSLHTGDDEVYMWMPGDKSVGVVNPDNMFHDLIANFFGPEYENVIPFTVISAPTQKKYIGLYIMSKDGEIYFAFMRKDQVIVRKSQTEVIGNEGTLLCLETSTNENIFFAGGSTRYDLKTGIAKICALSFDEHIRVISDLTLPTSGINTMGVSDIKRMPDRDVLFTGVRSTLFVVEWTGSHFVILNQIVNIHSWLINNIDVVGSTVFTVSKMDDHINKISFGDA